MADALEKVRPGDPLAIPAATFNTMIDAARDYLARRHAQGQSGTPAARDSGIVLVRNDSGADRARLDVLGVSEPLILPADNGDAFGTRVGLSGVTPIEPDHVGRFVILLEPIPAGEIGLAYAGGVCPVLVSMSDASHRYADIDDGSYASLASSQSGTAAILWVESGTGSKYAIVRLGDAAGGKGLPSNANKSKYMVLQLSDDVGADDDPSKWTIDYVRAHG